MRPAGPALLACLLALSALPLAGADFSDTNDHLSILYNLDQTEVDILILPSASPYALRDAALVQQSIQMWDDGIDHLGQAWLAAGLNLHQYRVGIDPIPVRALWDPEIVVVPAEANPALLLGTGLEPMNVLGAYYCHGIPPPEGFTLAQALAALPGFHQHKGSAWGSVAGNAPGRGCASGGATCFVVETNFLWTPDAQNRRSMYDLTSHEVGHCLGLGHVGDDLDFTATTYPHDDIMGTENDGGHSHVLCVSTLDVLGLERVFGWLLGQPGYPQFPAGSYVELPPTSWWVDPCAEPTASPLGAAPALSPVAA
jgi:hypothetical protein